jgi:hypothetical protein
MPRFRVLWISVVHLACADPESRMSEPGSHAELEGSADAATSTPSVAQTASASSADTDASSADTDTSSADTDTSSADTDTSSADTDASSADTDASQEVPNAVIVNGALALSSSPGSARIEFNVEADAFCDPPGAACEGSVGHISIHQVDGTVLVPARRPLCGAPSCDVCEPVPCPGFACLSETAVAVGDQVLAWDGSFEQNETCGQSEMACRQAYYVPPGRYVAQACANAGNAADGCEAAATECVSVEFDFPSAEPLALTLSRN